MRVAVPRLAFLTFSIARAAAAGGGVRAFEAPRRTGGARTATPVWAMLSTSH